MLKLFLWYKGRRLPHTFHFCIFYHVTAFYFKYLHYSKFKFGEHNPSCFTVSQKHLSEYTSKTQKNQDERLMMMITTVASYIKNLWFSSHYTQWLYRWILHKVKKVWREISKTNKGNNLITIKIIWWNVTIFSPCFGWKIADLYKFTSTNDLWIHESAFVKFLWLI